MKVARVGRSLRQRFQDYRRVAAAKPYLASHTRVASTIDQVRQKHLTFLSRGALVDLAVAVDGLSDQGVDGAIVEAGAALGGSTLVIAAAKEADRALSVYDTFGLIPPPSDMDDADVHARYAVIEAGDSKGIGGTTYYGYRDDLLGEVRSRFIEFGLAPERHNVEFIQGLYEQRLLVESPVALAHIDCDWYESVKVCLERIDPWLAIGGRLIIDDYDEWSGARKAVDEFLAGRDDYTTERHARLHVLKCG